MSISVFYEYEGPVPKFPFDYVFERAEPLPATSSEIKEIFRTNLKVFESDISKRQKIIEVAIANGFKLVADHIVSTTPAKEGRPSVRIVAYDRLIFSYVSKN